MTRPSDNLPVHAAAYTDNRVTIHVTVRGHEWPWLSRLVGVLLIPVLRWRTNRRRRVWQPHLERIIKQVEGEFAGRRSHPDFDAAVAARLEAWFREHPDVKR